MDFLFDLDDAQARVVGTMSKAQVIELPAGSRYFGVRFRPGAITRYISATALELRDADAPLTELVPEARALEDAVFSGGNAVERRFACIKFLHRASELTQASDGRVLRAAELLSSQQFGVPQIALRVGLGERQLERVFLEQVGLRPKQFARAERVQLAIELSRNNATLATLAAAAGFADESHMSREFKALAGCTPGEFIRERQQSSDQLENPARAAAQPRRGSHG
jgi:AraC-like DNA-binding protein